MLGILLGYEGIGERWRTLIGDTLVVSPQIVGIEHASTITGLARETAEAGLAFVEEHGGAPMVGAPARREAVRPAAPSRDVHPRPPGLRGPDQGRDAAASSTRT